MRRPGNLRSAQRIIIKYAENELWGSGRSNPQTFLTLFIWGPSHV
jgi:hypothetical protein